MQNSSLTGSPYSFELVSFTKPVPIVITGSLLFFAVVFGLIPFVILYFSGGIKPGILVALFVAFYVSYLLLRMALWNLYGKEFIRYDGKSLNHQYDYRFFRSQPRILNGKLSAVTLPELLTTPELTEIKGNESDPLDAPDTQTASVIVFHVDEHRVTTTLPVSLQSIENFFDITLKHF